MSTMTPSVPEWDKQAYYDDTPYEWLFQQQGVRYFQRLLAQVQEQARKAGVVGFTKMWNEYVRTQNSNVVDVTIRATEFPDQPVQLKSGRYTCDENGVHYTGYMGEDVIVISHPIMPVKRIVSIDTGLEKLELAYQRGRENWRTIITNKNVISSAQRIIELSAYGIAVTSENAKEVVKFLSDIESENYDTLPVQLATGHMGWLQEKQFAPYCKDVVYDGDSPEGQARFEDFKAHGEENKWMEVALQTRAGESVPARMALAASFAAPLLKILNGLPFFVHLWGEQGCGKTVGLMLAASVWGDPVVGGYVKTFDATKVALETVASFYCNVPVFVDELQVKKEQKTFDDIIYMLCEGVTKGRGTRDGGVQRQKRWQTTFVTTGEMPITKSNSGGGAKARTIEVNYGGQPLFKDPVSTVDILKENYGWAGRKFVEALMEEGAVESIKETQKKFRNKLSDTIDQKQLLSASILLTADKIADLEIFHDGRSLTVDEVMPYLISKAEADVNARCYQWLLGTIGSNQNRFVMEDNHGELWGIVDDGYIYIIRTIFDRLLNDEGFSNSAFLTWAKRKGLLRTERTDSMTFRRKLGGQRVQCIALALPPETENEAPEGYQENLPFD